MRELLESRPEWLRTLPADWVVAFLVVIVAYAIYRLIAHRIGSEIHDAEKRHRTRKRVGYTIASLVFIILSIALFEKIRELGTLLGFIGAGLAIALREYLASFLAWFYILAQRNINLGSRIEVGAARGDAVRGDVIDIGVFKLTLVEVRGTGLGDQSSGRLVTIPNFRILIDPVYHFTLGSPYVWDEIEFMVTFESDWEKAREIIGEVGRSIVDPHQDEIEAGFRQIESTFAFRYGVMTPIVYTTVGESGIMLRLRYLTNIRKRLDNRDVINRELLKRFQAADGIDFAYPTTRSYRTEIEAGLAAQSPAGGLRETPFGKPL